MDRPARAGAPRLPGFDYATPRAYFVTVCTMKRCKILSDVEESGLTMTPVGLIVAGELEALSTRFHGASVEPISVVMPDHIHAIVWLSEGAAIGLQAVVGLFKAGCTRECRRAGLVPASCPTIWQRSFYDRIIRTEQELSAFRLYIQDNPRRWFERRAG